MLVRTNIYLQDQMLNYLKTRAKEEKVTMSDVVRRMIAKEVEKKQTNWAQSLLELSKKAKGSGLRDLSKRHDYYLYIEPYEKEQAKIRNQRKKIK